jgi:metal-dependent amidase/aminoacylase/carboxypeptidase family protein
VPEDRMPVGTIREDYTPATVNTAGLTEQAVQLFTERFGADRVRRVPPPMVGEDFGRYVLAAPEAQSLIFWVGGVPQAKWQEAGGDITRLPSLHSPFWAPDAEAVIGTATEAMTAAAINILKK